MKLVWKGEFSGDESTLPAREPEPGAVQFREMEASRLMIVANVAGFAIIMALFVILFLRGMRDFSFLGALVALVSVFPHEFLHAICFKGTVYVYSWLKKGAFFVVGTETMSKGRFIFLSLLPNLVFGLVPYTIALVNPHLAFFGTMGAICLGMGTGDYYNVLNALRQMPKGSRAYLSGFHSFWYPAPAGATSDSVDASRWS